MLRSAMVHVVMGLLFTGLGLTAGWRIWRPKPADPAIAAPPLQAPAISPQARRNMGIVMGEIKSTPWTRSASFPATLEVPPGAEIAIQAPAAGTLLEVRRRVGEILLASEVVATIKSDASGETISIVAPPGSPDWDLVGQKVSPGAHFPAGADLFLLRDSRTMRIRAESGGADASILLEALKNGTGCNARPLLKGNGPDLHDLKFRTAENAPSSRLTQAVADAANEPLAVLEDDAGGKVRTWSLRPGQKYVLTVPLEILKRTYVVPSDALADDGPDKVVFLQSGDAFLPEKVVVLHRDSEVAVLDARGSALAPGDIYVERGAFALSLALRSANAITGHTHPH